MLFARMGLVSLLVAVLMSACGDSLASIDATPPSDTPYARLSDSPTPTVTLSPTPTSSLDNNYGGLSLGPNDNSLVNIYMVYPSQAQAEALAKKHLDPILWQNIREVRVVKVKYSKNQLESWFQLLYEILKTRKEVTGGGVSIKGNNVSIGVVCGAALEEVKRASQELMATLGIPRDAVVVEVTGQAILLPKPAFPFTYACLPHEVLNPATGLFSPGFGGMYIEHDTIKVYLLEPSQSLAVELSLAYFGRKIVDEVGEVQAVQGQYTWEQLQGWWRLILDGNRWEVPAALPCTVDPTRNRITIEVKRSVNENVVEEVEEWLSELSVPREAVTLMDGDIWPGKVPLQ